MFDDVMSDADQTADEAQPAEVNLPFLCTAYKGKFQLSTVGNALEKFQQLQAELKEREIPFQVTCMLKHSFAITGVPPEKEKSVYEIFRAHLPKIHRSTPFVLFSPPKTTAKEEKIVEHNKESGHRF